MCGAVVWTMSNSAAPALRSRNAGIAFLLPLGLIAWAGCPGTLLMAAWARGTGLKPPTLAFGDARESELGDGFALEFVDDRAALTHDHVYVVSDVTRLAVTEREYYGLYRERDTVRGFAVDRATRKVETHPAAASLFERHGVDATALVAVEQFPGRTWRWFDYAVWVALLLIPFGIAAVFWRRPVSY